MDFAEIEMRVEAQPKVNKDLRTKSYVEAYGSPRKMSEVLNGVVNSSGEPSNGPQDKK